MLFNNGEFYDTHIVWEHIWKEGDAEIRKNIKGFIQLSAGVLKYHQGNNKAAKYLLEKTRNNVVNADKLADRVAFNSVVDIIKVFLQCPSSKINILSQSQLLNSLHYNLPFIIW